MTTKSLTILGGLAIVLIGVALLLSQPDTSGQSKAGQYLFPGLMEKINEVSELSVKTQAETITIARTGESWIVKEKHDYPANMEKLREAVVGLGELKILEAKTKKPELYDKLGLEDVEAEGSFSTGLTLKDAAGAIMAEAIVGKQEPSKGSLGQDEVYVRKPGDPQTWLAIGKFSVEKVPSEWLDKDFLEVEPKRVRQVTIKHQDNTKLVLKKERPDDQDFTVVNLPKGKEVQSQFAVNNIVATVTSLGLEDVKPASEVSFDEKAVVTALFQTFDGLEGNVKLFRKDEKDYVKVSAVFNADLIWKPKPEEESQSEKPENEENAKASEIEKREAEKPKPPKIKPEGDVKTEIETINKKVADWVYVIPKFRADTILKKPEDLIKKS
ncbi:DUF4340 domain-containing protein [Candidatus Nitronereus thalassa]|uniref:DUF4340 domain-containing protein n=1 Tax=Candidatus Nitronereus thalassa TaxID=3020898 RepID=A0ABU3K955_9BACT|nr:DUF4340 domain-containing protein [Candidatus Nitronereus thalassa]MDT7042949.1 DUF4340 domain-containing protein [Candidatus Nitronereus thalassa]